MQDLRQVSGNESQGIQVTHDLRKTAHAVVTMIYSGRLVPPNLGYLEIECEVYKAGDILSVHTVCPKCRHSIWIDGRNKKVEYELGRGLFVEPFTCTWEMSQDRQEFGFGLCQFAMVYEGKVAREA
jgi:hypothetical protein